MKCRVEPQEFTFLLISLGSRLLHIWISYVNGYDAAASSRQMFRHTIQQLTSTEQKKPSRNSRPAHNNYERKCIA
jgi:hypothetical protein